MLAYKTVLEKDARKEADNLSIKDVYIKYKWVGYRKKEEKRNYFFVNFFLFLLIQNPD